ncbi:protein inturned [Frankliniella occidentalis]|uniref:Protein inturned n=1 Tax=Frankliniella occidentalis TaxID=133901 RepID=A0A6J1RY55_FRAOC|nr:protein inturned [Frankliniella occidentalis]
MHSNRENIVVSKHSVVSEHYSDGSDISSDNELCSQVESWESSHSSSCSSCSDSASGDESVVWENEIRYDGRLTYIESDPSQQKRNTDSNSVHISSITDGFPSKAPSSKLWTNGGKLVRLIRRRESKRHYNNISKGSNSQDGWKQKKKITSPQEVASTPQEQSSHLVELHVDPWVKPNLGRRATVSETLLGLVTTNEESAVIITDFVPEGLAAQQNLLKLGDRICSINGRDVTAQNFNTVLEAINVPCKLSLSVLSKPKTSIEKTNIDKKTVKIYQTPLAERISKEGIYSAEIEKMLLLSPVGVLYLQLDGLTEGGPEDQGVLYCYPGSFKSNILGSVRGAFLTLFQLIPDITHSTPKSSSILVNGEVVHIIYVQEGRELLLIAVPNNRCSIHEAEKQCHELVKFLQFTHQTLSRCFSSQDDHTTLNHTISTFLSRILLADKWADISDCTTFRNMTTETYNTRPQFELILQAAHVLPLPREAQVQIDDALSELESNDIGDSCEDLDFQRLFTILGCCVYHKGYLLGSHLTHLDLLDVHAFCRQQGLVQLNQFESVRSLVIWREVYPSFLSKEQLLARSDTLSAYTNPEGRWFLMIVGQKQDMLVTLLEAGGCSLNVDGHPPPDVLYVEAAQDTLQHLRKIGVFNIASEWLETQLRPQLTSPETVAASRSSSRKVNNLLGLRMHHEHAWQNNFSSIINSPSTRKSTDSLVAGRRRQSPDHSSSGILHGGETSEDSASLVASLPSDDPVFSSGRLRADRDHGGTHISHSDHDGSEDSDSDWDASDTHTGQRNTSTTDLSDLHNSLLKNVEGTVPLKLTMGVENIVFHYVHLDTSEGVLLSPVKSCKSLGISDILSKFRHSAMHIHTLFQNTISFKKLKSAEASHSLINKSLVAIKEFGVLFEYSLPARGNEKSTSQLTYWVVGRLFFMPSPKEVYVCYEDSAPQNLIELAFRLALTTTG